MAASSAWPAGTRLGLLTQEAHLDRHFSSAPSVRAVVRGGAVEVERMEVELAATGGPGCGGRAVGRLCSAARALRGARRLPPRPARRGDAGRPRRSGASAGTAHQPSSPAASRPASRWRGCWWPTRTCSCSTSPPTTSTSRRSSGWRRPWSVAARRSWWPRTTGPSWTTSSSASGSCATAGWPRSAAATRPTSCSARRPTPGPAAWSANRRRPSPARRSSCSATAASASTSRCTSTSGAWSSSAPPSRRHPRQAAASASRASSLLGSRARALGGGRRLPRRGALRLPARDPRRRLACPSPASSAWRLRRGERIGLVGPNGAGKSTLLRTIAGQLPDARRLRARSVGTSCPATSRSCATARWAASRVLDALLAAAPVTPGAARSYLARFLFRGDDVEKPVAELSGGERSRLELALLGVGAVEPAAPRRADEPPRHPGPRGARGVPARTSDSTLSSSRTTGDSWRRSASASGWCNLAAPASPAMVAPFDGGYREWRTAVAEGWTAEDALARRPGAPGPGRRLPRRGRRSQADRASAGRARRDRPLTAARSERARRPGQARPPGDRCRRLSKDAYRRERARIETDLARLGERKSTLESGLSEPAVQANFVELRRLSSELADVDAALGQAEDAWLTLEERAPR